MSDGTKKEPAPGFAMPPPSVMATIAEHETTTKKEPTTAEAFATVRQELEARARELRGVSGHGERARTAVAAIALLERRMGAQDAAIRGAVAAFDKDYPEDAVHKALPLLNAALAGAPPVFTLEEVEKASTTMTDVAEELYLAARHPANPGSTNGTLVQQATRLREVARTLRR